MDPQRLNGLLRIFVVMGVLLPLAPRVLGFPHDPLYCMDVRLGDGIMQGTGFCFLVGSLLVRCATVSDLTPAQQTWLGPKIFGIAAMWFALAMMPWPW